MIRRALTQVADKRLLEHGLLDICLVQSQRQLHSHSQAQHASGQNNSTKAKQVQNSGLLRLRQNNIVLRKADPVVNVSHNTSAKDYPKYYYDAARSHGCPRHETICHGCPRHQTICFVAQTACTCSWIRSLYRLIRGNLSAFDLILQGHESAASVAWEHSPVAVALAQSAVG
jgi:hypothetical protein